MRVHLLWLFTIVNLAMVLGSAASTANARGVLGAPVGTKFTYQGRIKNGAQDVNGTCDFQFGLWSAETAGSQIGTSPANGVVVTGGRFTVLLDFGASAFNGEERWLSIAVRCPAGSGAFTALTPRQALTPSPYAMRATSAGSVPWSGITGVPADFADGVDNGTAYTPGAGIAINGSVISVAVPLSLSASNNQATLAGDSAGVYGYSDVASGTGVIGEANNGTLPFGVWGLSNNSNRGVGVSGWQGDVSQSHPGSSVPVGVLGSAIASNGIGVFGLSSNYKGVEGISYGTGTNSFGVQGYSESSHGVYGSTNNASAYAGYFAGNVRVTGSCCSAVAGTFQIDHPLDPANKYLTHAAVESSEMKNIYDGVVTLGADGAAVVELPEWFEALNQEFRYQLTCIGGYAPVYIAKEISGNQFSIAGGQPGLKVSWQVTGVRSDPYARQNPVQLESSKPAQERGTYLYPQGYGQPATKSVDQAEHDAIKQSHQKALAPSTTP